jgi:hypothetical protein
MDGDETNARVWFGKVEATNVASGDRNRECQKAIEY